MHKSRNKRLDERYKDFDLNIDIEPSWELGRMDHLPHVVTLINSDSTFGKAFTFYRTITRNRAEYCQIENHGIITQRAYAREFFYNMLLKKLINNTKQLPMISTIKITSSNPSIITPAIDNGFKIEVIIDKTTNQEILYEGTLILSQE